MMIRYRKRSMMIRYLVLLILFTVMGSCADTELARFEVTAGEYDRQDWPVRVEVPPLAADLEEAVGLFELTPGGRAPVPFQLDFEDGTAVIRFMATGVTSRGTTREYVLLKRRGKQPVTLPVATMQQDENELILSDASQPVLSYRISEIMPPEGVDSVFRRSAYIHPFYSPGGMVLTRIQPPDHYHHYGIWNPWTLTHINGREIDYWNLGKGEGTVRTKAVLETVEGPVFSAYTALQQHIDKGHTTGERVTMDEFWEVTYWGKSADGKRYILDLHTTLRNVLQDTILFDAYRYGGGLGYRATGEWNNENSTVLTSEGADRATADGTRARWCIVEGASPVKEGRSGILFMSHPENREHPEPMRVWPPDSNHGELFFEFCPIRHNDWVILPGRDYLLKYRMVVFDGAITAEEAERYWNGFAYAE
ncbi:MAG: PmoA family protein [Bacteroidales bacterium]|nr:PmoA family protein [Bacteroidales bacterium]